VETGYGELLLDWLLRGTTLTPPATWYLGLDISLTGSAYTEPTYTGYARAALARASGSWVTAVGNGQAVSAVEVAWPAVPAGYTAAEQVRRVFISDSASSSGEHLLDYVPLADAATLLATSTPTLASGVLVMDAGDG
jgi:hypothetical protein